MHVLRLEEGPQLPPAWGERQGLSHEPEEGPNAQVPVPWQRLQAAGITLCPFLRRRVEESGTTAPLLFAHLGAALPAPLAPHLRLSHTVPGQSRALRGSPTHSLTPKTRRAQTRVRAAPADGGPSTGARTEAGPCSTSS